MEGSKVELEKGSEINGIGGQENSQNVPVVGKAKAALEDVAIDTPMTTDETKEAVETITVPRDADHVESTESVLAPHAESDVVSVDHGEVAEVIATTKSIGEPASEDEGELEDVTISPMPQSPVVPVVPAMELPAEHKERAAIPPALLNTTFAQDHAQELTASPLSTSPYRPQTPPTKQPQSPTPDYGEPAPQEETPTVPVSPLTPAEASARISAVRDSMASVALSDTSLDYDNISEEQLNESLATPKVRARESRHARKVSSLEILGNMWAGEGGVDVLGRLPMERQSTLFDISKEPPLETPMETSPWADTQPSWHIEPAELTAPSTSPAHMATASESNALLKPSTGAPSGGWHKRTSSLNAPTRTHARTSSLNAPSFSTPLHTPVYETYRNSDSSGSGSSEGTLGDVEVDWQTLDANEEQEKEDLAEDESTVFLLARLEQENAKIASFTPSPQPATAKDKKISRIRSESRPPSMGHLKKLVQDRNAPSIRYSLALEPDVPMPESVPEPPPMTELEFWAALVQDYPSTASRLPTLTTTKIRAGIPPPLRGVVWTSMAGARDKALESAFEELQNQSSPYEGIINKDVGRSFPGVDLFREADGEGQRMLGRVLKCFSLHDKDIGYCQGLGFLVGPLLMNMGERDAFCVLVRLMDHYSLRPSFLPSLSGLHMRIFQFSSLLKQHQPQLSEHFTALGIEPAYLSQWFLSCFAVTCPLPMLFRIYDVIFAEGANETVMRVALALMRRNEQKMLEATEFEEVMQLLLGRGIWDSYGMDPDEMVDDFTSLGNIITHSRLAELEKEFEKQDGDAVGERAGFLPDVQAAASRFLGRLWAPSHGANKSTSTLSPSAAEKDAEAAAKEKGRGSFLRRSPSKQSISTLNEGSESSSTNSSGNASLASTATTITDPEHTSDSMRESTATNTADAMSFKSGKAGSMRTVSIATTGHGIVPATPSLSKEERDMHGQIEDLLTALSEMQREHAGLAAMLQREREERGEDQRAVRSLLQKLRKPDEGGKVAGEVVDDDVKDNGAKEIRRRTLPPPAKTLPVNGVEGEGAEVGKKRPVSMLVQSKKRKFDEEGESLEELLDRVNGRLETNKRISASFETKAQLRSTLARTREQLAAAETSSKDLSSRLEIAETSLAAFTSESDDLRNEVKELRVRVNEEFKARQKLEHTISELRAGARVVERKERERLARAESSGDVPTLAARRGSGAQDEAVALKRGSMSGAPPGLRELRLGRRDSTSSIQSLRTMRGQRESGKPAAPAIQIETRQSVAGVNPPSAEAIAEEAETEPEAQKSPSPPTSAVSVPEVTPAPTSATSATPASAGLSVPPTGGMWHARTSSLATKEVLATPEHEVVPEEALLLELVNAKTAEAQARAEVDELKRALTVNGRKHDTALSQLQKEMDALRAEAANAKAAAENAKVEAESARNSALGMGAEGLSVPTTPAAYDSDNRSLPGATGEMPTPAVEQSAATTPPAVPEKKGSGSGGGWFWNRRTPSASANARIAVTPPAD